MGYLIVDEFGSSGKAPEQERTAFSLWPWVAPAARAQDSKETNPEVEKIRALLKAHDEAMTNHDLKGVMACLTEKAAIMATGPGEIWVGPEDIKVAYEHFFEGFDKGEQNLNISLRLAA